MLYKKIRSYFRKKQRAQRLLRLGLDDSDEDDCEIVKTTPASESKTSPPVPASKAKTLSAPASETKSVASVASRPEFRLHSSKMFQNQLGTLQHTANETRKSSVHNGTLLATIMAKLIVMEGAFVTILNATDDIRERLKKCPHGSTEEHHQTNDDSATKPDEDHGDDNSGIGSRRPFVGENTRYENNSRTFEVNIHNPTVHISTSRGVEGGDGAVNEKENVSFLARGLLCF